MNSRLLVLLAGSGALCSSAFGQLWYSGDYDGGDILLSVKAFPDETSPEKVYDNFTVGASGWNVTSLFENVCFAGGAPSDLSIFNWEIRSGVSAGNGGTLVASGTSLNPTVTATGRTALGGALTEYKVTATGLDLDLSAGTYWLGGNFGGPPLPAASVYIGLTHGANGVGSPIGNAGTAFVNGGNHGWNWQPTDIFGAGGFSMGVDGKVQAVPEPTTLAALAGFCGILARRRRAGK